MTKHPLFTRLKSRRGIAVETAVLFILIVLGLCTLILTLSLMGRYQNKSARAEMLADIEKEQICEDFISYVSAAAAAVVDTGDTQSFYSYIHRENHPEKERYKEFYGENGKYNCFDIRTLPGDDRSVIFKLYALDAGTNQVILYAEAEKNSDGTVKLLCCLSDEPQQN